jgi:hypothetical protein
MADACEAPRFSQHPPARCLGPGSIRPEQLQRDFSLQLGIPRAIDLGRRAFADFLEQDEAAPPGSVRRGFVVRQARLGGRLRQAAVEFRNVGNQPQLPNKPSRAVLGACFGGLPIDLGAVGNRRGQVDKLAFSFHGLFPPRRKVGGAVAGARTSGAFPQEL